MVPVVQKYAENYLWHVDKLTFDSSCVNHHSDTFSYKKDSLPPYIYTSLCFGENVEDEWFIVYILLQISKDIPGIIIRVWDADGEFLLIEAADHLPNWCNPDSCCEKVFLYKGDVHIVQYSPQQDDDIKDENCLNVQDLLNFIRNNEDKTKATTQVQNNIQRKVKVYPDIIQEQVHYAHAYIPVTIAKILKVQPHLISHVTRAFCQRDALDMKTVKNFPHFSSETKVMQRIKFTKCLYAMLVSNQYVHPCIPVSSNPDHKKHSIGVKLMCGFEILLSQVQDRKGRCEKQWNQSLVQFTPGFCSSSFLSVNLTVFLVFGKREGTSKPVIQVPGYFKDLLEGSKEYKELESMARDFYMKNQAGDVVERSIGNDILDLMQDSTLVLPDEPLLPADSDSWMSISSQDLDQILQEKFGMTSNSCGDAGRQDLVSSAINKFLHHSSGVEGAEFPHG
ncbi:protein ecdysoneless homolog, partial [Diaphorina citri]|uniref:Protein ecdysoneless homolog n=1 Tax=Diaphorina citri TaxID=121845 RepID=A0A1S4EFS4_DIACI